MVTGEFLALGLQEKRTMKENVRWIGWRLRLGVIGTFLWAQFVWATPLDDYINADNPSYTYGAPVVQYTELI